MNDLSEFEVGRVSNIFCRHTLSRFLKRVHGWFILIFNTYFPHSKNLGTFWGLFTRIKIEKIGIEKFYNVFYFICNVEGRANN